MSSACFASSSSSIPDIRSPRVKGLVAWSVRLLSMGTSPLERNTRRNCSWLMRYCIPFRVLLCVGSLGISDFARIKKSSTLGFRTSCCYFSRSVFSSHLTGCPDGTALRSVMWHRQQRCHPHYRRLLILSVLQTSSGLPWCSSTRKVYGMMGSLL